jgi:hypothetical protein
MLADYRPSQTPLRRRRLGFFRQELATGACDARDLSILFGQCLSSSVLRKRTVNLPWRFP